MHSRLYKDALARSQVRQALLSGTEVRECLDTLRTTKTVSSTPPPPKEVLINLEAALEQVEQPMLNSAHDRCAFTKKMFNGQHPQLCLKLGSTEPAPPDFLEMTVLQRNQFWETERQRKLQSQRAAKVDPEAQACTFSPDIKRHRVRSSVAQPAVKKDSYLLKYQHRQTRNVVNVSRLA